VSRSDSDDGSLQPKSRAVCARDLKKEEFPAGGGLGLAAQQVFPKRTSFGTFPQCSDLRDNLARALVSLFGESLAGSEVEFWLLGFVS
jgi:hypothetical protein